MQVLPKLLRVLWSTAIAAALVPFSLEHLISTTSFFKSLQSVSVAIAVYIAIACVLIHLQAHATVKVFVNLHRSVDWSDGVHTPANRLQSWIAGPQYLVTVPITSRESVYREQKSLQESVYIEMRKVTECQ
eukprot:TRINITY_DN13707_c0_g3_i1.p3 TRINITY_DN13707_c0_g3~~TRINITY_DN13707_c0_g3_i1.p3  ORF type:complete len:131 (+),score=0.12 TRINITY_DN13707_c0_g3_i1:169-561(+)